MNEARSSRAPWRWIFVFAALIACAVIISYLPFQQGAVTPPAMTPALEKTAAPLLRDDGDAESLLTSVAQSLSYYESKSAPQTYDFGTVVLPKEAMRRTLQTFAEDLRELGLSDAFFERLQERYVFFRSTAPDVLFTGYFEAQLKGSLTQDGPYQHPLYKTPPDLLKLDLSKFFSPDKIKDLPRVIKFLIDKDGAARPYYSRQEIDYDAKLAGKNLELVWIDDLLDVFFLHIQGSGVVTLPNGDIMRVNYAEQNGHPYRAIGKYLVDQGLLEKKTASMQGIKAFLRAHPERIQEILTYNQSYIFFRPVEQGPVGSIGRILTPERSLAMDSGLMPKGALLFIDFENPLGPQNSGARRRRFVLNQDTGGAIRGPARADFFTGRGDGAETLAGGLQHRGMFYFLVLKDALP